MSNLFDALNRGRGELPELILPLLDETGSSTKTPSAAQPSTGDDLQSTILARIQAEPVHGSADTPAGVPRSRQFQPVETQSTPPYTAHRTLPIRIASPSPLLPFDGGNWQASEQYRIIRTRIAQDPQKRRVFVVSSAGPGDGKTITAINIAGVLGLKNEAQVLLVDADFRRSSVHHQLGLAEGPGISDVLAGAATLEQALIQIEPFPNLYLLTACTAKANPVELLDNPAWPALCSRFREMFRYVVFDSPPMAAVADYDLIQAVCDGFIMVVRPDHTNRRVCLKALTTANKDRLIGVLLNCVPRWFLGKYTTPESYYYSVGSYD